MSKKPMWTPMQQQVIWLRNRNILVSAAAGSGKTAVLVQRIITLITEGEHPLDIDQLLVVTFTKAAAAEMRERVGKAIEELLEKVLSDEAYQNEIIKTYGQAYLDHQGEHLQKQRVLIHHATIMTIDSFCLNVLRSHFNEIDLDPSFRIADENELKLLKGDIVSELLEDKYAEKDENFLTFMECYSPGKTDAGIEEKIIQVYDFSRSHPYPMQWFLECREKLTAFEQPLDEGNPWMAEILDHAATAKKKIKSLLEEAIAVCHSVGGPLPYLEALDADAQIVDELLSAKTYAGHYEILSNLSWKALSRKKAPDVLEKKKTLVKELRAEIKDQVAYLQKTFFFKPEAQILEDGHLMKEALLVLIDLVEAFTQRFADKKQEKNMLDFGDLEHKALEILRQDGEPTETAREYSEIFEAIMCDEYQDSNQVQELLLKSVSRETNMFMVGDVKQSIYRFRMSDPTLFMEKYERYTDFNDGESKDQKIELDRNFRSSPHVLFDINFFFKQVMTKSFGDVDYNERTSLYPGAGLCELTEEESMTYGSEIMIADMDKENIDGDEDLDELTAKEMEAHMIADRIKALIGQKRCPKRREASEESEVYDYDDIVILLRTMTGWSDVFVDVLMSEGIPCHADTSTGFFDSLEVRIILNMLGIIDNPRQDLLMASVLHSDIAGVTTEELALIRGNGKQKFLYENCLEFAVRTDFSAYQEDYTKEQLLALRQKVKDFLELLNEFRKKASYQQIHELLYEIYDRTGFEQVVLAMPGGERRTANLTMLVQQAIAYEKTSYSGLFNFIRYIDKLKKYEVDFGEAYQSSGKEASVRIMSIHKSKGLEYPVCFVSGLGKKFNLQDSRQAIVIHQEAGFGANVIRPDIRTKTTTLAKNMIAAKMTEASLSEELRVLYVALTRAADKLILTGSVKKFSDSLKKWYAKAARSQGRFDNMDSGQSYLDWVIPTVLINKSSDVFLENHGYQPLINHPYHEEATTFKLTVKNLSHMILGEIGRNLRMEEARQKLFLWDEEAVYDLTWHEKIRTQMQWDYPFLEEAVMATKMTVSELKRIGQEEEASDGVMFISEEEAAPEEIEQRKAMAAKRGTAVHRILEELDIEKIQTVEDVKALIETLVIEHQINTEIASQIYAFGIFRFAKSDLAKEMVSANQRHQLYKEQQFVMGVPARRIYKNIDSDETILVQGIIDAYYEDADGEIVLVDYKTDSVSKENGESLLKKRYHTQLDYYQMAIEKLTGKKVKRKLIYSVTLGKSIEL